MNIIDVVIILIILCAAVVGFKRGVLNELVMTVGFLLVFIISFYLKNPVADFLSPYLPFFRFGGAIEGVTVLNIILYQLLAFLIVFSLIMIVFRLILSAIVGAIEGYIIAFIVVFILNQPMLDVGIMDGSKFKDNILDTPVLNEVISSVDDTVKDVYHLIEDNRYENDPDGFNREAIDIMLEHKMITVEYVEKLIDHGKIRVPGIDSILNKYR